MSDTKIRPGLLEIEEELIRYDNLRDNLKSMINAYRNLAKLEHRRAEKFHSNSQARYDCIDAGNQYMNFANSITRLLNEDDIKDILKSINFPLKYLEEDS